MPRFKVIRASAGSGKTFSLTQEYLRLILTHPGNFRHILAVTFTNKATEEMKSRIIKELYLLSSELPSNQLEPLIASTGLTREQIREQSASALKLVLHKYSWFSVNTIDTFFQRIIRNFTRELGIQDGYSIELETDVVLTEIIDTLLLNAENDHTLLRWLSMFAESLIEKGENWNLKKSIRKLGSEIFREDFKNLGKATIDLFCNREYMAAYRKELHIARQQIEKTYREIGKKALDLITSQGLSVEDFSGKGRGPAGFFARLAAGEFKEPGNSIADAAVQVEKWYTRTSTNKMQIEKVAREHLMPLLQSAVTFYNEHIIDLNTTTVILKNLFTLGILFDLSKLSDEWCSDNDTFLLPEAPVFLNRIIDGNDTPFIYEKAGCWFHHFMIDEFQDTSTLQWNNFIPLISNSLSQNYDNLAVGDIKQSIYRWRNSSWEILQNQIQQDFPGGIIDLVYLRQNRRSADQIVRFNNEFFARAAEILQQEFENKVADSRNRTSEFTPITELYSDLVQQPSRTEGNLGYVNVQFIDENEESSFTDEANRQIIEIIYSLLEKGYELKDIAILTRTNPEASLLAEFLLNYNGEGRQQLSVISDEALFLGSSVVLNIIVSLLRNITDPADANNNYYLKTISANYLSGNPADEWKSTIPVRASRFISMPAAFDNLIKEYKSFSLTEICEQLIRIFDLDRHPGEIVYLMAFRDLIKEYTRNHSSNLIRFLEFWDETGCSRSVAAPAGQDALRVMTLHKSKGLEFKIVIIPYCNWKLNTFDRSFIWCKPDTAPYNQLPVLPIAFTSRLEKTIFAADYFRELQKQLVDNLNLMYVAFTRAREAMYVLCRNPKTDNLSNVSALVKKVLGNSFEAGSLAENVKKEESAVDLIRYRNSTKLDFKQRLKIAFQGKPVIDPNTEKPARPVNEGRILHEIFNRISKREDIHKAVSEIHLQGKITTFEKPKYISLIEFAMNDLQVSTWFTGDWTIINEAEIIIPGGEIRRPDRVMRRDNQTLVIDYKFGLKKEPEHEKQVREYAGLLKTIGYKGVEGYLWYVRLGKVIQVKL